MLLWQTLVEHFIEQHSRRMNIHHLTLNTGHVAIRSSDEMNVANIERFAGFLGHPDWPIPDFLPWRLQRVDIANGGCLFQISREPGPSKMPVVCGVTCWQAGSNAWERALIGYNAIRPSMPFGLNRLPSTTEPPLPWLAVWMTPDFTRASPADLIEMGHFEAHIAWIMGPHQPDILARAKLS